MDEKKEVVHAPETVNQLVQGRIDATQVTFFVWMMYSLNIITRIQVRDFLEIIKAGKWPEDVVKFLADEVKKI